MFNALNALSERESLLVVKPWVNKWLILAIIVSFSQHFLVMCTPPRVHLLRVSASRASSGTRLSASSSASLL
jgi:hypothetical protein